MKKRTAHTHTDANGYRPMVVFLTVVAILFGAHVAVIYAPAAPAGHSAVLHAAASGAAAPVLETYQRRMLLATAAVYLVFILCGVMFIQRVLLPLHRIREKAREIAGGNLHQLVEGRDETRLGHLGSIINDIAMNLQEVLLLAWTHARRNASAAEEIADGCGGNIGEADSRLRDIAEDLRVMQALVQEYDFYHVQLTSGTVTDPEAEKSATKRS